MILRLLIFSYLLIPFYAFAEGGHGGGMDPALMMMMMNGGGGGMNPMMMGMMMQGQSGGNNQDQEYQTALSDMKESRTTATGDMTSSLKDFNSQVTQGESTLNQSIQTSVQSTQLPDQTAAINKATTLPDSQGFYDQIGQTLNGELSTISADGAAKSATVAASAPQPPHPKMFVAGPTMASQFAGMGSGGGNSNSASQYITTAMGAMSPKAADPVASFSHTMRMNNDVSEVARNAYNPPGNWGYPAKKLQSR